VLFESIVFNAEAGILFFTGENESFYLDGTCGKRSDLDQVPKFEVEGENPFPHTCGVCLGSGKRTSNGQECQRCAGTGLGTTTCSVCAGLGWRNAYEHCHACMGAGRVPYGSRHV
jgi:DnaJ-class molecular chaperone